MQAQLPANIHASPTEMAQALEALASELAARGWAARLYSPTGRLPSLYAQNPEPGASVLSEHVNASPCRDGSWWYWWPWADKIASAADPNAAAATITRVLRVATDAEPTR